MLFRSTPGTFVKMPDNGDTTLNEPANLLVRVAVTQDANYEVSESFTLTATNTGGTGASGTGTIVDDGTGVVFLAGLDDPATPGVQNPTGVGSNGLPLTQATASTPVADPAQVVVADDDRPVTVNSVTVNEGSPYIIFTVGAVEGQYVKLSTGSGTATVGTDTSSALEYWNEIGRAHV